MRHKKRGTLHSVPLFLRLGPCNRAGHLKISWPRQYLPPWDGPFFFPHIRRSRPRIPCRRPQPAKRYFPSKPSPLKSLYSGQETIALPVIQRRGPAARPEQKFSEDGGGTGEEGTLSLAFPQPGQHCSRAGQQFFRMAGGEAETQQGLPARYGGPAGPQHQHPALGQTGGRRRQRASSPTGTDKMCASPMTGSPRSVRARRKKATRAASVRRRSSRRGSSSTSASMQAAWAGGRAVLCMMAEAKCSNRGVKPRGSSRNAPHRPSDLPSVPTTRSAGARPLSRRACAAHRPRPPGPRAPSAWASSTQRKNPYRRRRAAMRSRSRAAPSMLYRDSAMTTGCGASGGREDSRRSRWS